MTWPTASSTHKDWWVASAGGFPSWARWSVDEDGSTLLRCGPARRGGASKRPMDRVLGRRFRPIRFAVRAGGAHPKRGRAAFSSARARGAAAQMAFFRAAEGRWSAPVAQRVLLPRCCRKNGVRVSRRLAEAVPRNCIADGALSPCRTFTACARVSHCTRVVCSRGAGMHRVSRITLPVANVLCAGLDRAS